MSQMAYPKTGVSRRGFMIGIAGLTFAVAVGREGVGLAATQAPDIAGTPFNPWVSIAPSGEISIIAPATEMGQGSLTSLPLILAEELDADWSKVVAVPAPPIDKIYGNPAMFGAMLTAHSLSLQGHFMPLRTFGAQVRAVLLDNVATHWRVPLAELSTEPSVVFHSKSGRRIGYGDIVAFAEIPEVAPDIKPEALKKSSDFRLIGHDVMRVELPTKVNGSAKYAIDVQVPGMIYGAILRSPVLGGAPDKVDDAAAKAVAGVIDVVRLLYGVGVLATTPWAAFVAKSALEPGVTWRRSGKAWGFDSDKGLDAFAADARDLKKPTVEWYKQGDAEAALATAATVIEAQYRNHYTYHAQMEPLNAIASVSATGDAAEVWCGTQFPTAAQAAAARALDIPAEKVKLNYTLLGGGFGRRGDYAQEFVVDAVLMSKSARRPVKVMWTREDDVHYGHFRPITAHYLRGGLDASGKLIAYHHRLVGDRVLQAETPIFFRKSHGRDYQLMGGVELKSYDIPRVLTKDSPENRSFFGEGVKVVVEVVVDPQRQIDHFDDLGDDLRAAVEPCEKVADVAVVLFDGNGQVFAGEELVIRDEAVIALPIIGDERLAFEADFVEELLACGVITATKNPGDGSPSNRVIGSPKPQFLSLFFKKCHISSRVTTTTSALVDGSGSLRASSRTQFRTATSLTPRMRAMEPKLTLPMA